MRGKWHMMGVNLSAGGSLQWFRNALCQADVADGQAGQARRLRPADRTRPQDVPPAATGLFFLPYLSGERTPHADPDARGCFVGLTLGPHARAHGPVDHGRGDLFDARQPGDHPRAWSVPIRQIRASGGGSRSPLWRQIQADVFGRKVVTINSRGGRRPTAWPCWRPSARARSTTSARPAGATIRVVRQTAADRAARRRYDRAFAEYQQLYRSLCEDFKRITALG